MNLSKIKSNLQNEKNNLYTRLTKKLAELKKNKGGRKYKNLKQECEDLDEQYETKNKLYKGKEEEYVTAALPNTLSKKIDITRTNLYIIATVPQIIYFNQVAKKRQKKLTSLSFEIGEFTYEAIFACLRDGETATGGHWSGFYIKDDKYFIVNDEIVQIVTEDVAKKNILKFGQTFLFKRKNQ